MKDEIHPAPSCFSSDQLAADPILQFFHYAHLPAALQTTSRMFCELAAYTVRMLPRNAERSVALRKLLEAKDAAVRANVGAVASGGGKGDFFTRLKLEAQDLGEKLRLLDAFLARHPDDAGVSAGQREMLLQQKAAMTEYLAILKARIENIEHGANLDEVKEIGGADADRDGPVDFGT